MSNKYKYLLINDLTVEYTNAMSDQQKKFIRIRSREASDYAAQGYYVVRNDTYAQVEISELGASVKTGDTMALLEWDSKAELAKAKGLVKLLASPQNGGDGGKKQKKKADEEPVIVQAAPPVQEIAEVAPVDEVNTSLNKTEELGQQEEPF